MSITEAALAYSPPLLPGTVWLVGAGPGDPGLLTLHALSALRQAEVVLYDALLDSRILGLVPAGARLEPAGKRGGRPSPAQPDISNRLIELAREGYRIVRLKGGDPFVFGRGGEEALALAEAGIPFRIVPGVTSGIGGLAYAGIPVTHRGIGRAVTLLTGHEPDEAAGGLDWSALARMPTLVCYMALGQLPAITDRLMRHGRDGENPLAVVANASRPDQQVIETTLARAAADARLAAISGPALVVVGEVVRLRAELDWLIAANPV
jgi:uroporphyrin-III C-methyltransferase